MNLITVQNIILVIVCIMLISALYSCWRLKQKIKNPPPKIGRIVIDHSDPDGPHAFLEVDKGCLNYFEPENEVLLDIVEKNYLDN